MKVNILAPPPSRERENRRYIYIYIYIERTDASLSVQCDSERLEGAKDRRRRRLNVLEPLEHRISQLGRTR